MKTLQDFISALTLGSRWHTYNHATSSDLGVREVVEVLDDRVIFQGKREDGKLIKSAFPFPDESEYEAGDNGQANIYWKHYEPLGRRLALTYSKA